ncbi:MAG: NB-ARC domain-containing protein, partial [Hydrococcus sp. Prado102]|nr:NB-ARC domain-containing protein [Hydrococcus sp. Prado102]
MTLEEALLIVEQAVEPKQLNKIQKLILQHSWQGHSYIEIAKATGYDCGYIKDAGSKLWQMLSNSFGEKIDKQNCQAILKRYFRQKTQPLTTTPKVESLQPSQDWGEAIDTSIFYGRSREVTTLSEWIVRDKCRLIGVLGMGGVGKTTLSVKVTEEVQEGFEFLFWRS